MEKKYYYIDSRGSQFGPLTIDELIGAGINPNTYIWRAGLSEWILAKRLPEVASHMNAAPTAPEQPAQQYQAPTQQPTYAPGGYNTPAEPMPTTYLGWSIAATLLCCIPTGIVAIIYASQVNSKWSMGDYAGACRSASLAKTWFWVSVGVGLFCNILSFIFYFFVGLSSALLG